MEEIMNKDYAEAMRITPEEMGAMKAFDEQLADRYPKVRKEYAALEELEEKMMDPEAIADSEKWEGMKKQRKALDDTFRKAMKKEYGIELPAMSRR